MIMRQSAKRKLQIERVIQATVEMYHDVKGIAGKRRQEIERLSLSTLEDRFSM
jgi:hypothetical protein